MSYDIAAKVVVAHASPSLLRWFMNLDPEEAELLEQFPQEPECRMSNAEKDWFSSAFRI